MLSIKPFNRAKGADARRRTERELREFLGGEVNTAAVLRVGLKIVNA